MPQLPTPIEPHSIDFATSGEDSYVFIAGSNLGDLELIEEPHLGGGVPLLGVP